VMHLLWVLPLVAGLAARWSGKLESIAMLVALMCGLIGLAYLLMRPRGIAPPRPNRNETRATSSETYPRRRDGDTPRKRAQPVALTQGQYIKLRRCPAVVCLPSDGNPG